MAVSMRFLLKLAMLLLWFRFFGIHVKAYIYVMYLEILNMEVLMLRSLGPLIRSGMVLCSDEWGHWSIALSPTNRERINQTFKLELKLILLITYEETNKRKCYLVVVTSAKTTTRADCSTCCIPNSTFFTSPWHDTDFTWSLVHHTIFNKLLDKRSTFDCFWSLDPLLRYSMIFPLAD